MQIETAIINEHFKKDNYPWVDIVLDKLVICIEKRNWYCDRGRFSIKIFTDTMGFTDEQDAFPRYFFLLENLVSELEEFIKFRKYEIKDIKLCTQQISN